MIAYLFLFHANLGKKINFHATTDLKFKHWGGKANEQYFKGGLNKSLFLDVKFIDYYVNDILITN